MKHNSSAYLYYLGTLLPLQKGHRQSITLHLMGFADNCKTGFQNGRSQASQRSLGRALEMVCVFPECLVASLRACLHFWAFPSLSRRDSFAHLDEQCMPLPKRCVFAVALVPWGSIMWSTQQIWGKRLYSKRVPWFHSPNSHPPSLPPSLHLLPGWLLGLWAFP